MCIYTGTRLNRLFHCFVGVVKYEGNVKLAAGCWLPIQNVKLAAGCRLPIQNIKLAVGCRLPVADSVAGCRLPIQNIKLAESATESATDSLNLYCPFRI